MLQISTHSRPSNSIGGVAATVEVIVFLVVGINEMYLSTFIVRLIFGVGLVVVLLVVVFLVVVVRFVGVLRVVFSGRGLLVRAVVLFVVLFVVGFGVGGIVTDTRQRPHVF